MSGIIIPRETNPGSPPVCETTLWPRNSFSPHPSPYAEKFPRSASSPGGGSGTPRGVCADHISLLTRSENRRLSPDCGIRPAANWVITHRDISLTFELMAPAGAELLMSVYGIACRCPSTLEWGVAALSPG